jgi:hypothetical protein
MTAPKSENPATGSVNGVRSSEQLGGELSFQTNNQRLSFQAVDMSGPLEFALNGREVISAFNSPHILNVRRWYRAQGGSIRPTPKGLACAIRHLPAEAALLADTLARVADTLARAPSSGLTISVSK